MARADPEIGCRGRHLQCPLLGDFGTEARQRKRRERDAEGVEGVGNGEGYSPSTLTRDLGERRKLPQRGPGGASAEIEFCKIWMPKDLVAHISLSFLQQFHSGCTIYHEFGEPWPVVSPLDPPLADGLSFEMDDGIVVVSVCKCLESLKTCYTTRRRLRRTPNGSSPWLTAASYSWVSHEYASRRPLDCAPLDTSQAFNAMSHVTSKSAALFDKHASSLNLPAVRLLVRHTLSNILQNNAADM